jgi:hypothetical protein
MNAALASVATFAIAYVIGPREGLLLALLLTSPTLWGFMAQTEILAVALGSLAISLPSPWNFLAVGLMPWANQKNVVLAGLLLWFMPRPWVSQEVIALAWPSLAIGLYVVSTGRLKDAKTWLWDVPKGFGKTRTWKANVLSARSLLVPCVMLFAVPVATMGERWEWVAIALIVAGGMVLSKQIVPHHFLLLAFPVALGSNMGLLAWLAYFMVAGWRDLTAWLKPELTYRIAFPGYREMLEEAGEIEQWIRANTKPDEVIWVDGMENQIYFNTGRKAWRIEIPELPGIPSGEAPRVIVFCQSGKRKPNGNAMFDYSDYKTELISQGGRFVLMVKK